jgi:hypothetical protein
MGDECDSGDGNHGGGVRARFAELLPMEQPGAKLPAMNIRPRIRAAEETRKALEDLGGEPLDGSGFEHETPSPEFTDSEPQTGAEAPQA